MRPRAQRRQHEDIGANAYRAGWREDQFCVLDFETTGLDAGHDQVLSYGLVPVIEGRVISSAAQYGLVRPTRPVSPDSIRFHTLRDVDLAEAPPWSVARETIAAALQGRVLVAHSVWVERSFLEATGVRRRQSRLRAVDTAALARHCLRDAPKLQRGEDLALEYVAHRLGLPVHTPHHALGDAMTTAQVFVALANELSGPRQCGTGRLVAISRH